MQETKTPPPAPTQPPTLTIRNSKPPPANPPSEKKPILLRRHLSHLSLTLQPLLSVKTGHPHPYFPPTLLHYHLLTEFQLDSLAEFYHQSSPSMFSFDYPAPVVLRWNVGPTAGQRPGIEDKRRRFGRFVGLRGCESPEGMGMEGWEQMVMDRWVEERVRKREERGFKGSW